MKNLNAIVVIGSLLAVSNVYAWTDLLDDRYGSSYKNKTEMQQEKRSTEKKSLDVYQATPRKNPIIQIQPIPDLNPAKTAHQNTTPTQYEYKSLKLQINSNDTHEQMQQRSLILDQHINDGWMIVDVESRQGTYPYKYSVDNKTDQTIDYATATIIYNVKRPQDYHSKKY